MSVCSTDDGEVELKPPILGALERLKESEEGSRSLVRRGSDLRAIAMQCHKQISKDVWGKKDPNSFVDHLRPQDVEAFALDIALRTYWELHRQEDEVSPCTISSISTALLRQMTLKILEEHQTSCTTEHLFEVPDPVALQQREEEKQKQIEASKDSTKQRSEAIKKEREERKARLEAKRTVGVPLVSPRKANQAAMGASSSSLIKISAPPQSLASDKKSSVLEAFRAEGSSKTFTRPTSSTKTFTRPIITPKTTVAEEAKGDEEGGQPQDSTPPPTEAAADSRYARFTRQAPLPKTFTRPIITPKVNVEEKTDGQSGDSVASPAESVTTTPSETDTQPSAQAKPITLITKPTLKTFTRPIITPKKKDSEVVDPPGSAEAPSPTDTQVVSVRPSSAKTFTRPIIASKPKQEDKGEEEAGQSGEPKEKPAHISISRPSAKTFTRPIITPKVKKEAGITGESTEVASPPIEAESSTSFSLRVARPSSAKTFTRPIITPKAKKEDGIADGPPEVASPPLEAGTEQPEDSTQSDEPTPTPIRIRPNVRSACKSVEVTSGLRVQSGKFVIQAPSDRKPDRAASTLSAFQIAGAKKKEKTFKRPLLSEEQEEGECIPKITLKRTLVDTQKLVPHIQRTVSAKFSDLSGCSTEASKERQFEFFHFSVKGPRPQNEDELAVVEHLNEYMGLSSTADRFSFFGAYDGHSGKYTSLFIRSQVHHKVCNHPEFPHNMEKAIHDVLLEVDEVVNDVQEREEFACGSTVLSVWVRNRELIVGNVGDCRGFICRGGSPQEIAIPHNPDREDERQRIVQAGGAVVRRGPWRVNGILAVSRSIGDNNLKKFVIADPEVTRFVIQDDDEFVVIASDGLWDVISPDQMIRIVKETCQSQGRKYACQALCKAALDSNSNDNVTVLLMFVNRPSTL